MDTIPLTRVSMMIQFTTALEEAGSSPERLLRRLNMPMWHHCRPDDFVPLIDGYRLAHHAARTVGTESFGVRMMECIPIQHLGAMGALIAAAPNVYQAIKTLIRVVGADGTARRWGLAEGRNEVWLHRSDGLVFDAGVEQAAQHALVCMVQVVRLGAGPGWRPSKVRLQAGDTLGLHKTEMFSEALILPDPDMSAIAIPRSVLSLPLRPTDRPGTSSCEVFEERFQASAPAEDFVGSLRQVITTLLYEGYPKIEFAAEMVGVHARTLQRMLVQHGTGYRKLVDRARFDVATHSLLDPDATVTDIAFDLGYTDAAHFTRAFRRWAGVSPSEYRSLRLAN